MAEPEFTSGSTLKFHGVTYEHQAGGEGVEITIRFARHSSDTASLARPAADELGEAARALTDAVSAGAPFREIGDLQERFMAAQRAFDGLHRKWVTQATTALNILQDFWTVRDGAKSRAGASE
uniref:Uncharacterized protein n=1 Tax=Streptomyces sp. NBC_00003 TaxID=2903608 RepID=A0AAU2V6W8_9ACTN